MNVPKAGDIFKFPISKEEFAFGRVLLNTKTQCIDTKKIDRDNPLYAFRNAILVEIYAQTTSGEPPQKRDVLIPGIFTSGSFIQIGMWEVVGFDKVNQESVDFPEGLSSEKTTKAILVKGELRIPFDMDFEKIEEIDLSLGTRPCTIFGELVLFQLNRKNEINNPKLTNLELRNLANYDLRFSDYRHEIYELSGFDEQEPYYKKSKKMGFDLARFYEQ